MKICTDKPYGGHVNFVTPCRNTSHGTNCLCGNIPVACGGVSGFFSYSLHAAFANPSMEFLDNFRFRKNSKIAKFPDFKFFENIKLIINPLDLEVVILNALRPYLRAPQGKILRYDTLIVTPYF